MDAVLRVSEGLELDGLSRVSLVIWELPRQLPGSLHRFKYRLALMDGDVCVMRFDNEAGKGDHKHIGARELAYDFIDIETLQVDFWMEVEKWQNSR